MRASTSLLILLLTSCSGVPVLPAACPVPPAPLLVQQPIPEWQPAGTYGDLGEFARATRDGWAQCEADRARIAEQFE